MLFIIKILIKLNTLACQRKKKTFTISNVFMFRMYLSMHLICHRIYIQFLVYCWLNMNMDHLPGIWQWIYMAIFALHIHRSLAVFIS